MPWQETHVVDLREKFIVEIMKKHRSLTECCAEFGVSRKTGSKWLQRFFQGGVPSLLDLSRRPHHSPQAVSEAVAELVVAARQAHPLWGPRKLRAWLTNRDAATRWPASSTIGDLLKRRGLVGKRRRRQRTPCATQPLAAATESNLVWCADFKGQFRVAGVYCHPLTITDAYSRYLLRVTALDSENDELAKMVFEATFREFGLPLRIRTDNGRPFATTALGGLSQLSVWWVRLGITPERIAPGHPEQNGRHERMHRTLKDATARPPKPSAEQQRRAFDDFVREYNQERPHESLGQRTPASVYSPSPRPYPEELPDPEYPPEFQVRRVYKDGRVSWNNTPIHFGKLLAGQALGFEQVSEGRWQVWFGPIYLGLLIELANGKIEFIPNKPKE
jgi:transposase InsO family protein